MINSNQLNKKHWNLDNSYTQLPQKFYSLLKPTPVNKPRLIIFNDSLANYLGLDIDKLKSEEGVKILAGNSLPAGGKSLAQAYAGHQFGHFTILGDGRAILLGEQITPAGQRYDIQLKGAGRTPYSRGGDGRAALGPMLREYIISEAMYHLNIPTTRSLAVVTTGEKVYRETALAGAVLTRVASSHIRVGTFQYIAHLGRKEELKALADYTLQRHFPPTAPTQNKYLFLLQEVIKKQAILIAKWQLVGFIHGVMNTDNMLLSGETVDYGPCAFMDTYKRETVFSSIDARGRYAYINQPLIAKWNLARFAETLLPLLHENIEEAVKIAETSILEFDNLYKCNWLTGMRAKLGLLEENDQDESFINELLSIMEKYGADYTNTFRSLTIGNISDSILYDKAEFKEWYKVWQSRLEKQNASAQTAQELMRKTNPAIIPRNYRVEEVLRAAEADGDFSPLTKLLKLLTNPYAYSADQNEYVSPPEPSPIPYRTFCGT